MNALNLIKLYIALYLIKRSSNTPPPYRVQRMPTSDVTIGARGAGERNDVTIGTGEGEGAQGTQGEHGIMQGMAL